MGSSTPARKKTGHSQNTLSPPSSSSEGAKKSKVNQKAKAARKIIESDDDDDDGGEKKHKTMECGGDGPSSSSEGAKKSKVNQKAKAARKIIQSDDDDDDEGVKKHKTMECDGDGEDDNKGDGDQGPTAFGINDAAPKPGVLRCNCLDACVDAAFSRCDACGTLLCKTCTMADKDCRCVEGGPTGPRSWLMESEIAAPACTYLLPNTSAPVGAARADTTDVFAAFRRSSACPSFFGGLTPDQQHEMYSKWVEGREGGTSAPAPAPAPAVEPAPAPSAASPSRTSSASSSSSVGSSSAGAAPSQLPARSPAKLPAVDRGEAQQSRAVPDDPHVDDKDETTWGSYDYHRDCPEPRDVIYYAIQKNKRADARLRGARFDWGPELWYADCAEHDSIKLLDAKYKRKPCLPPRKWSSKEARYPLCYENYEEKDGATAANASSAAPSQWAPKFNAPGPTRAVAAVDKAEFDIAAALARIDGLVSSGAVSAEFASVLKQDACRKHCLGQ